LDTATTESSHLVMFSIDSTIVLYLLQLISTKSRVELSRHRLI